MTTGDSPVKGLIYLVIAVAVIGGIVRALRWAWKKALFAFGWTKGAAKTLALAALLLLLALFLWSLLELAGRKIARVLSQRRARLACALPRLESVRQGRSRCSALDDWMTRLFSELAGQVYGVEASGLSESDFQHLRVRLLPMIWSDRAFRIWFESHVIAGLYGKLMEGDARVQTMLEQAGHGPACRRPFWLLRRLFHGLTGGRLGLSQAESFKKTEVTRLRSDPRAFARFVYERLPAVLLLAEHVLEKELAPAQVEPSTPTPSAPSRARPIPEASAARPTLMLPPARVTQLDHEAEPRATASPEPVDATEQDATRTVEQICELLEDPDHEGWDEPGAFLADAKEELTRLASRHPAPAQVHQAAAQVQRLQAGLEGFAAWWASQMAEEDDTRWAPLLTRELAQLEDAPPGQLARTLRRRCCLAYLHAEDPGLLEPSKDADRKAQDPGDHEDALKASATEAAASKKAPDLPHAPKGAHLSFFPPPARDIPAEYGL
ncbi:MAG: hypothetical protein H6712_24400 [Myxococcales bacterium]|nr:hypothetical protein [Myxococcales bacterium]